MSGKHSYKLYYFQARGAAETIRLAFALADVEYEDIRISAEEWPEKKKEMPQGLMPVLEIDGVKHCQNPAILRYLAREFGLYTQDSMKDLVIDEVYESLVDMTKPLSPVFFEKDEEVKAKKLKEVVSETFPKFIDFICSKIKENGTGYVAGNSITIADIATYQTLNFLKDFIGKTLKDYDPFQDKPELKTLSEKIESNPKISAWIAKRPKTEM